MLGWLIRALGWEEIPPTTPRIEGRPPAPLAERPSWLEKMPGKVLAIDVETTGLHSNDRVVSFAGILLDTGGLASVDFNMRYSHLLFDPCKKSHPRAEAVHGYSDWLLRHQSLFSAHADAVCELLSDADLIVAHNAEFDVEFVNRELALAGKPLINKPTYCTMEWHRAYGPGGRANLTTVAGQLGFYRANQDRHGALEDAWLALMVYLSQQGCPHRFEFSQFPNPDPRNILPAPPQPSGPLPRRNNRKKQAT